MIGCLPMGPGRGSGRKLGGGGRSFQPVQPWVEATFVVVPDPQLAQVAQAQHVGEVECICVVALKLVPVG